MKTTLIKIILSLTFTAMMFGLSCNLVKAQDTTKVKTYCGAMTTKQQPCKVKVATQNEKCFNHSESKILCGATCKTGQPCKRPVKAQGEKCFNHNK